MSHEQGPLRGQMLARRVCSQLQLSSLRFISESTLHLKKRDIPFERSGSSPVLVHQRGPEHRLTQPHAETRLWRPRAILKVRGTHGRSGVILRPMPSFPQILDCPGKQRVGRRTGLQGQCVGLVLPCWAWCGGPRPNPRAGTSVPAGVAKSPAPGRPAEAHQADVPGHRPGFLHAPGHCRDWFCSALAGIAVVSLVLAARLMGGAYSLKSHVFGEGAVGRSQPTWLLSGACSLSLCWAVWLILHLRVLP